VREITIGYGGGGGGGGSAVSGGGVVKVYSAVGFETVEAVAVVSSAT
jgi:hypothetical protein